MRFNLLAALFSLSVLVTADGIVDPQGPPIIYRGAQEQMTAIQIDDGVVKASVPTSTTPTTILPTPTIPSSTPILEEESDPVQKSPSAAGATADSTPRSTPTITKVKATPTPTSPPQQQQQQQQQQPNVQVEPSKSLGKMGVLPPTRFKCRRVNGTSKIAIMEPALSGSN
ncbi:hypothetical protein BDR26DRAFT_876088 [Obelidium mucronatum]|nr:hypothetical protein BDR26DRAFT_876088 [Obelidium mucronatum]